MKKKRIKRPLEKRSWLNSESSVTTTQREKKAAKLFDAERVVASGATPWAKEDLESHDWLYQHKYTKSQSHTVTKVAIDELKRNAIDKDKKPCYVIDWDGEVWCMVPYAIFRSIMEEIV